MQCHKCPHREALESGRYRDIPFDQTPCAGCELHEHSHYTVEFDAERAERIPVPDPDPEPNPDDLRLPLTVMAELVRALMSLRPEVRDVVTYRYSGLKYREIAKLQNTTPAAAEQRHREALTTWPALRELFPRKSAKCHAK